MRQYCSTPEGLSPQSRRHFLTVCLVAAAAGSLNSAAAAGTSHDVGAVTGAIKKQLQEDWLGTLKQAAAAGFRELEFSDPLGPSDKEAKKALDDLGLKAVAGGASLVDMLAKLDPMCSQWRDQGKSFLACYWPWRDNGKNKTLEDYRVLAKSFNDIGRKTKARGLRFVFHHHALEFIVTDGKVPYDLLLEETDPDLVSGELDLYWLAEAGADPVKYLKKFPNRFPILHLGDLSKTGNGTIVCPGEGTLDFRPALEASKAAGVQHVMVENPDAKNGMDCLAGALQYVRKLGF